MANSVIKPCALSVILCKFLFCPTLIENTNFQIKFSAVGDSTSPKSDTAECESQLPGRSYSLEW